MSFCPPMLLGAPSGAPGMPQRRKIRYHNRNNTVFITRMPPDADERTLADLCSRFGFVTGVFIERDEAGHSLNYAFVELDTEESARRAIVELDRTVVKGPDPHVASRAITVAFVKGSRGARENPELLRERNKERMSSERSEGAPFGDRAPEAGAGVYPPQSEPDHYRQPPPPGDYHGQPPPGDYHGQPPPGDYYRQPPPGEYYRQPPPGEYYHHAASRDYYRQPPPGDYHRQPPAGDYHRQPPPGEYYRQAPPGDYYRQPPPGDYYHHAASRDYYRQPPPGDYYHHAASRDYYRQPPPRDYYHHAARHDHHHNAPPQDHPPPREGSRACDSSSGHYDSTGPSSGFGGSLLPAALESPTRAVSSRLPPGDEPYDPESPAYDGSAPSQRFEPNGPGIRPHSPLYSPTTPPHSTSAADTKIQESLATLAAMLAEPHRRTPTSPADEEGLPPPDSTPSKWHEHCDASVPSSASSALAYERESDVPEDEVVARDQLE